MKVIDKHDPAALRGGDMEVMDIGISTDPEDQMMILNILSSTLYSNKPKAVLREYGCNAFDANVDAGKADTPFTVRLPNQLKQTLSIRDFGKGMTEDEMRRIFCFMGRSTKRNSNDFVGMLGIGSKAGFAYGDYFTVTSYSDGIKTIYNCHRDKGVPKMALMSRSKTDEPNGIEVEVPVRQQDVSGFVNEAEKVYRYFKVRPKITGATVVFKDVGEIKFQGTGWKYRGDGTSAAIMGNVGYDLNIEALGHDLNDSYRSLIGAGVELEFAIGEIEIAPNREGLQYTDITKTQIKARLDVVINEVSAVFTKQISTAKTMWEARKLYGEAFEQMGTFGTRTIRDFVKGTITWQKKPLDSGQVQLEYASDGSDGVHAIEYTKPSYRQKIQKQPHPYRIYCNDSYHLVENDISVSVPQTRLRGFFEKYATSQDPKMVLFRFDDDKSKKKFIKDNELEGAPWELLSSIPKSTLVVGGGGSSAHNAKHSAKVFVFNHKFERPSGYYSRRGEAQSLWWDLADVVIDDGGVYVEIENFLVRGKGGGERCFDFSQKVKEFRSLGLLKVPLYGFKRPRARKLDATVWKTLDVHLAEELDDLVKRKGLAQDIADYQAHANYTELFEQKMGQKYLPDGTIARLLVDECVRMSHPKTASALMKFLQAGEGKPWVSGPTLPAPTVDLEELEGKVLERYPMINTANWESWRSGNRIHGVPEAHVKHIADYISLVESA